MDRAFRFQYLSQRRSAKNLHFHLFLIFQFKTFVVSDSFIFYLVMRNESAQHIYTDDYKV